MVLDIFVTNHFLESVTCHACFPMSCLQLLVVDVFDAKHGFQYFCFRADSCIFLLERVFPDVFIRRVVGVFAVARDLRRLNCNA